jgi:hypothetical protein
MTTLTGRLTRRGTALLLASTRAGARSESGAAAPTRLHAQDLVLLFDPDSPEVVLTRIGAANS